MSAPHEEPSDLPAYVLTCTVVLALIVVLQVLLHGW